MLTTERGALPTATTRRARQSTGLARSVRRVLGRLRAAGSGRAWFCLVLVWYVLGLAVLNLARFGLER